MRRLALLLILFLAACLPVTPVPPSTPPSSVAIPPAVEAPAGYSVNFHPDGSLYVGDQVSIVVFAPPGADVRRREVRVSFNGGPLATARFQPHDLSGEMQAVLPWVWDTTHLTAGTYRVTVSVVPVGPSWQETVTLLPRTDLPPAESLAHWSTVTSQCCNISYITGTDAARDIDRLKQLADAQAKDVARVMQADFRGKISITFISRTLGQGGFTDKDIYVSYLDRNYAGGITAIVLHHEMIHWLDNELGGDLRPTIFVEGLAVYLTGGHFKPEPIFPRAAALLETGGYTPLAQLADNFYPSQHETGYLEAAALTGYLIQTYGWEAFNDFYRHIHPASDGKQSSAINGALQERFGLTFDQLEQNFLAFLRQQTVSDAVREDLRLSIQFYDTVRRYQRMLDASAYYLTAWLPDGVTMRERGIVADYLRHPESAFSVGLETLLVDADRDLRASRYVEMGKLLEAVNATLDLLDNKESQAVRLRTLALSN
jgi:hypothetical protein